MKVTRKRYQIVVNLLNGMAVVGCSWFYTRASYLRGMSVSGVVIHFHLFPACTLIASRVCQSDTPSSSKLETSLMEEVEQWIGQQYGEK